ncbi:MAG: hypothetical protein FWF81_08905 [Defluviitaleaceae bacterium]|nr:hypothetical protein [Defluviitaleaceae bacterium]
MIFSKFKIWEWILLGIFAFKFIITANFIFVGSISVFNSDAAKYNLLVREQLYSRQFFPSEWIYGNDIQILSINFPMLLLSPLIENALFLRSFSVFLFTILLLCVLYLYSRYVFKDKSFLVFGGIIFTGFSTVWLDMMFVNAHYLPMAIFTLVSFLCLSLSVDENFTINKKFMAVSCALLILQIAGGPRTLGTLVLPLSAAFTMVYILDNIDATRKTIYSHMNRWLIWGFLIFAATIIGFIFFRRITTISNMNDGLSSPVLHSANDIELIAHAFRSMLGGMWLLFGAEQRVSLFSHNGVISLMRIMSSLLIVIIFPMLLTLKYKNESLIIKRLIIFSWTKFAVISIIFIFTNVTYNVHSIRYFIVPVILKIMLSGYYIYKHLLLNKLLIFAVSISILIFFLLISVPSEINRANNTVMPNTAISSELAQALHQRGLKMGYASWWYASVNTILSNFNPEIAPIMWIAPTCQRITPMEFITSSRVYQQDFHAGYSFLLLTHNEFDVFSNNQALQMVMGEPMEIFTYDRFYIIVYDYNISETFH